MSLFKPCSFCSQAYICIGRQECARAPEPAASAEKAGEVGSAHRGGTAMSDNVVHLSFKSPHVEDDVMAFLACRACRNKTYTLTEDRPGDFPLMRCAACGQHMGRMGWAYDETPNG